MAETIMGEESGTGNASRHAGKQGSNPIFQCVYTHAVIDAYAWQQW